MLTELMHGVRGGLADGVRQFNRHLLNPVMLRLAGGSYWYASRLEHVGRRSGRRYATPVVATPVPGGFVVPLPYGPGVDWLRNLQAAGEGGLVSRGARYRINDPRVFTVEELGPELPRSEQLRARLWRIDTWLRVDAVPVPDPTPGRGATTTADGGAAASADPPGGPSAG